MKDPCELVHAQVYRKTHTRIKTLAAMNGVLIPDYLDKVVPAVPGPESGDSK